MTQITPGERAVRTDRDAARQDGTAAAQYLREALTDVGVTLPSLRGAERAFVSERPHVELGGCTAEVAVQLADVLRRLT
jgi:hypothetical protein